MPIPLPTLMNAMTPFPYSIDVDASIEAAHKLMEQHNFHHLPVTEHGEVVGMLHDAALGRALGSGNNTVREHYRADAHIVSIDEPLRAVLLTMIARRLDAVVITRHGKLAGVFTTIDACRAFGALLGALTPDAGDDAVA